MPRLFSPDAAPRWLVRAARGAQLVMGALLLLSGALKVWEPVLFYWELVPYAQLLGVTKSWAAFARAGLLVAPFECVLGLALLANWRPRWTMPVAVALMAWFIALMLLAWKAGATDECGCFGTLVNRTPAQAAVEDVVMLALLLFAWWGVRPGRAWRRAGKLVLGGAVLSLLVGGGRFLPAQERLANSDLLPGVRLSGLEVKGVPFDLRQGEYLLELFSPKCGRCMASAPRLNVLAKKDDLPRVVGLSAFAHDGEEMKEFITRSRAQYPIGTISRTDYFRLTWKHGYPRLAYVKNGVVRRVWEHDEFPTEEAVRAAMAAP